MDQSGTIAAVMARLELVDRRVTELESCKAARPGALRPADDTEVMRLWRECGLPESFLGLGGSNYRLVAFARACVRLGVA